MSADAPHEASSSQIRSTDRELGELVAGLSGLGKQIEDFRQSNADMHRATVDRMGRLERRVEGMESSVNEALGKKAPTKALDAVEKRIDSLESTRDRGRGRDSFLKGALGAALAIVGIHFGGHLP